MNRSRVLIQDAKQYLISSDHEIHEEIAKGSTSVIRRGVHKKTGQAVAIKEIIQKSDIPPLVLERQVLVLRRLAEAAHVVKLFDVYEDNYKVWLIFEFIPGGDLLKKLTEKSNFEEKEVKHMIQSITSAAAFCHKNNILHRNIKV